MKEIVRTCLLAVALMIASVSCSRIMEPDSGPVSIPDGTPATLKISFGSEKMVNLTVSTRAESSEVDEARVHDLYVMIFDNNTLVDGSPKKIYGRYFSYEHLSANLSDLNTNPNEGWWVENKTLPGAASPVSTTAGAVKVSTITCSNAYLVVLANVTNAVSSFKSDEGGEELDDISYLNGIQSLDELRGTKVVLEQDIVNRKDLFLMMGTLGRKGASDTSTPVLNTSDMIWGTLPKDYDSDFKVSLKALDAKVKFKIRCKRANISQEKAVYWEVGSTPDRCYLFSDYNGGNAPDDVVYFGSEQAYFEGTEATDDVQYSDWYVFTFYMLENRQAAKKAATSYHDREKQIKSDTGVSGYQWWTAGTDPKEYHSGNYASNGKWEYANDYATYVKFDMVLTLTRTGITAATGSSVNNALTTDTIYTVHLGDFGSSGSLTPGAFDDYNTDRSSFYTYNITINNSGSIYAEVENDNERQAGQEGFLLLTSDEIVNADAHYEYHKVSFAYNPEEMDPSIFSWYVKTPFNPEGAGPVMQWEVIDEGTPNEKSYPVYTADGVDYKWVMFAVNDPDPLDPTKYTSNRKAYPGIGAYDESWKPSLGTPHPDLMDINQLIEYIFDQNDKEREYRTNGTGGSDFLSDTIKVTIYIDEYYYETNPLDPDGGADPDLWRRFVNAQPREMHILSDARKSRDRKSDVILSSHSIIQQSIQTIYNTFAPGLRSLWGCEHLDEIKEKVPAGWLYWPAGCDYSERSGSDNDLGRENGRVNSAYIWNLCTSTGANEDNSQLWNTYLDFNVDNNTPELRAKYQGMAFSCMTRNRDNDGNGRIDRNEVRWYMAATRQLVGMWVGNESLSLSARLYQPAPGQWRAHVVSSTAKKVAWSEEGVGATDLVHDWDGPASDYHTWSTPIEAAAAESVRCLRNIGTYDGSSGVTDISSAPYTQTPDRYFTIGTEGSGVDETTTFYFDRLDTKSIREYSAGELPYHPQTSPNNRVYVRMSVQPLSIQVDEFGPVAIKDINPNVSSMGRNPYCPEGWRFPNQSEYVLMSLYMDANYFKKDADGNNYSGSVVMPSRTYYDRGLYGSLRSETEAWESEKDKIGWAYSTGTNKTFCAGQKADHIAKRTRCVKDEDMTGTIAGDLTMDGSVVYANDWTPVTFNFSSTASTFTYASLKLCYTAASGNYRELDIPVEKTPDGLQYRETQTIVFPSLAELGLTESNCPCDMILQAQVKNLAGQTKTVDVPVTMDHPLRGRATVDFPKLFDPDKGMPVRVNMSIGGHNLKFASAKLQWKESGGGWNDHTITGLDTDFDRSYTEDIYIKDIFGNSDFSSRDFVGKKYSYRLVIESNDGSVEYSPVRSLEFVRYMYDPNPTPLGGWTNISECSTTWRYTVTDLQFSNDDFIEADMDLTNCTYAYIDGNADHDIGKDNIFGFSSDDVSSITNSIIWYYPSVQYMVAPPGDTGWTKIRIHAGRWAAREETGVLTQINLILDKNGIIRDGSRMTANMGDWNSRVKATLTGSSSIEVGSVEGIHHSRAIYNYIRVVRNREIP